jgi:YgiT-type zinc finger domain-containing protein
MMMRAHPSGPCALCGGRRRAGRVTHSVDLGTTVVVVRNVEAQACDQCGEPWLADATVVRLEQIVHEARGRGVEIEVVSLP